MKRERAESLFNLLGEIDDEIIAEAEVVEKKPAKVVQLGQKKGIGHFATIAACIAFLLVCIWGISGLFGMGDDYWANDSADDGDVALEMIQVAEEEDSDWDDDVAEAEWDEDGDDWVGDVADDWEDPADELEEIADRLVDYIHHLTDEQLEAVFPGLEYEVSAVAYFLNDGTLIEVEGFVQLPTGDELRIRVAEDEIQHTVIVIPETFSRFTLNDVEVEVSDHESASFMVDNIAYYMDFFDEDVVNQIILGGGADLSVLSGVVVP